MEGNPDCWLARNNLGVSLARRGQVDEAIRASREAKARIYNRSGPARFIDHPRQSGKVTAY